MVDTLASSIANVARLSNLVPGNTYDATVTALNDYGESQASDSLQIHAGMVPSRILFIQRVSSTTTSVTFEWKYPESNGGLSLTNFNYYFDAGQSGTFVQG